MRKRASGFYSDSLEMLLDTMCNVLGGILFITLALAALTRDSSNAAAKQSVQLTNTLASVTASNAVLQAKIDYATLQLRAAIPTTNLMRLPNLTETTKEPWNVIVRYGRLYPVYTLAAHGRLPPAKNAASLNWVGDDIEPVPGRGADAETGVLEMVGAFRAASQTNCYFAFWVYPDSFAAFDHAKQVVFASGMQYGWEPVATDSKLTVSGQGPRILPQD